MERRRRIGVLVGAAVAVGLLVGAGYVGAIRPLVIGSWAVVGRQLEADDVDGRPEYEIDFAPSRAGIRFALMLRNEGPLPMTVRLPTTDAQSEGDLDRIVGLRVDRHGQAEGSMSEQATMAVDDVEIPAFGQRWIVFGGQSASCETAGSWSAEASQSRQAIRLESGLLGVERGMSLELPFVQHVDRPREGVCA